MTQEIAIEIACYALAFLAGLLAKSGLQQRRLDGQFAKGKAEGYYEAIGIIERARKPKAKPLQRVK